MQSCVKQRKQLKTKDFEIYVQFKVICNAYIHNNACCYATIYALF